MSDEGVRTSEPSWEEIRDVTSNNWNAACIENACREKSQSRWISTKRWRDFKASLSVDRTISFSRKRGSLERYHFARWHMCHNTSCCKMPVKKLSVQVRQMYEWKWAHSQVELLARVPSREPRNCIAALQKLNRKKNSTQLVLHIINMIHY